MSSPMSRTKSRTLAGLAAATTAVLLANAPAVAAEPVATDNYRPSSGPLTGGNSAYEYAPTIIAEGGKYRMWYCGQDPRGKVPGDDILYAESTSLNGPFTGPGGGAPAIVFEGSGGGAFDGQHTCDPSVVKAPDGTYYMYYSAAVHDGETSIGVARSRDGLSWERMKNTAIIAAAHQKDTGNHYGAGQPSAVYRDGKFYLIFTDTTGAGALPNGAGQFAWRASTPTFDDTEVFTGNGWQAYTAANSRAFMVANAFSADWQYSDELSAFIVAHHNEQNQTTLTFLKGDNLAVQPYAPANFAGAWVEGPGIVSRPDKHAVDDAKSECGRVPIDVVHASKGSPPQDLVHKGVDIKAKVDCGPKPTQSPTPTGTPTTPPTGKPTATATPPASTPPVPPTVAPSSTSTNSAVPQPTSTGASPSTVPVADGGNLAETGGGSNTGMIAGIGGALVVVAGGTTYWLRRRSRPTAGA
ncbi:MAG: family 43 glycosylhydrolase [Streptomycetaceae bacterium]|nr:family 43 glycosylhydrolase [Streptomycetaceae bacterium]